MSNEGRKWKERTKKEEERATKERVKELEERGMKIERVKKEE